MAIWQKTLEFAIILAFSLLFLLVPYFVADSLYFPYITGKALLFRVVVELSFFAYLALLISDPQKYLPRINPLAIAIVLFGGVVFLADLLGAYPAKSFFSNFERMEGFITILHLIAFYFTGVGVFQNNKDKLNWVVYSAFAGFVLVAINAFKGYSFDGRMAGSLGNPIYLAIYSVFIFFLALFALSAEIAKKQIKQNFYKNIAKYSFLFFVIFTSLATLWFTGTRGAFGGMVIAVLLTGVLVALFEKQDKAFRKRSIFALLVIFGLLVVMFTFKNASIFGNSYHLKRYTNISLTGTIQARMHTWQSAWEGFKEKPLLGWGQENFHIVFNKYYNPVMFNQETWFDRPHNIIFGWLINAGALGLTAYALVFLAFLMVLFRSELLQQQKWILFALSIAYIIHNMTVFDNIVSYIFIYLVFIIVSVNFKCKHHSHEQGSNTSNQHSFKPLISETLLPYLMLALIAGGFGVAYAVNYPVYKTNISLMQALTSASRGDLENGYKAFREAVSGGFTGRQEARETLLFNSFAVLRSSAPDNIKQLYKKEAETQMLNQAKESPLDPKPWLYLGDLYTIANEPQKAVEAYKHALDLAPNRQIILLKLAQTYDTLKNKKEAIKYAKKAFELSPQFEQITLFYLRLLDKYKMDKEFQEASQLLEQMLMQNSTQNQ